MSFAPNLRTLLVPAALALALAGCETAPLPADGRTGALYRCIGRPDYDQAALDAFLADLKAHPLICKDGEAVQEGKVAKRTAAAADSVRVHAYVMDSRCRYLNEYQAVLPSEQGRVQMRWDLRDSRGRALPTGEYFVNVVSDRGEAGRDTSYHKVGWIQDPCTP